MLPVSRERRPLDSDLPPMMARWGTEHPSAPLIVVLHGNGTSEHSMIEIAPWLPHGPVSYAAVRAPFVGENGFVWFDEPAEELDQVCDWLLAWLDTEGDPDRPVVLLGFRSGVTVAGALLLRAPERFAGAVLLYGALPAEPELLTRGRFSGIPLFLAHGTSDARTPRERLEHTWDWLAKESGAPLWAERASGGAQLAGEVVGHVGTWLGDRLDHLRAHGENPLADGDEPDWPTGRLPRRAGPPPDTTTVAPQHQRSQNAPADLQAALWTRIAALEGVTTAPAAVGAPGTRALLLDRDKAAGPDAAYLVPELGEFAHQHPEVDGSLHVALPADLAYDAIAKGWAVAHPLAGVRVSAGMVLVPGPRDVAEIDIVGGIVAASHRFATAG